MLTSKLKKYVILDKTIIFCIQAKKCCETTYKWSNMNMKIGKDIFFDISINAEKQYNLFCSKCLIKSICEQSDYNPFDIRKLNY